MNEFKADLEAIPDLANQQRPHGDNASGKLLDICVQRNWPLAMFKFRIACGPARRPYFECECRIASLVRVGGFSTKKAAKQIAAQKMLDVIFSLNTDDDNCKEMTKLSSKVVPTYCECDKTDINTRLGIPLRHRHKFFQNVNSEGKVKIEKIFQETHRSAKERVHLMCRAMQWEYQVTELSEHEVDKIMVFELLDVNFDMVISGLESELYDEVLKYVSNMSGIEYMPSRRDVVK